MAPEVCS